MERHGQDLSTSSSRVARGFMRRRIKYELFSALAPFQRKEPIPRGMGGTRMLRRFIRRLRADKSKMGYIHPDSQIGKYVTIGYGTRINGPITIKSHKDAPVTIGRYCAIAYNVRIRARNHHTGYANLLDRLQNIHGFPSLDSLKGPVNIGNNVWLADNVIILSGICLNIIKFLTVDQTPFFCSHHRIPSLFGNLPYILLVHQKSSVSPFCILIIKQRNQASAIK